MSFWTPPAVVTVLGLVGLLGLGELLRRVVPGLRALALPACILAGLLGLPLRDRLGLDVATLELVVYHGLAVVFIALALLPYSGAAAGPGARSLSFGIPFMQALQIAVGLLGVALLGVGGAAPHPGLGGLLALGFEQGPGQALAMGAAWEARGLTEGAQLGLIMAAAGYAWSIVAGLPLVLWGRRRGLAEAHEPREPEVPSTEHQGAEEGAGGLEALTLQLALIGGLLLLTWLLCRGLYAVTGMPEVWGFHFILGAGLAMGARPLLARLPGGGPVDGPSLRRIAGLAVDLMTAASLIAIQVSILRDNLLAIALITTLGGVGTLLACLWLASRAFPRAAFEHAVVWFGMSTGTLAMGLALLRVLDPRMRSPAPLAAVLGSAGATPFSVPPLLLLLPAVVAAGARGDGAAPLWGAALAGAYALLMLGLWRTMGPLRARRPWARLWWEDGV